MVHGGIQSKKTTNTLPTRHLPKINTSAQTWRPRTSKGGVAEVVVEAVVEAVVEGVVEVVIAVVVQVVEAVVDAEDAVDADVLNLGQ